MIKVYKTGANVCIEGHPDLPNKYPIPTHQTRFEVKETSVVITDIFPHKKDRITIKLTELVDESETAISTESDAFEYLSGFIGQSFDKSSSSSDGATEATLQQVKDGGDLTRAEISKVVATLIPEHDNTNISYVATGNGIGEIAQVIYKLGATTVLTLGLTYDSSNRINGYTKS